MKFTGLLLFLIEPLMIQISRDERQETLLKIIDVRRLTDTALFEEAEQYEPLKNPSLSSYPDSQPVKLFNREE